MLIKASQGKDFPGIYAGDREKASSIVIFPDDMVKLAIIQESSPVNS